jgi:hypothetical protein
VCSGSALSTVHLDLARGLALFELVEVKHLFAGGRQLGVERVHLAPPPFLRQRDHGGRSVAVGHLEHAREHGVRRELLVDREVAVADDRPDGGRDPADPPVVAVYVRQISSLGFPLDQEGACRLEVALSLDGLLQPTEVEVHVLQPVRDLVTDHVAEHRPVNEVTDEQGLFLVIVDAQHALLVQIEQNLLAVGAQRQHAQAGLDACEQLQPRGRHVLVQRVLDEVPHSAAADHLDLDLALDGQAARFADRGDDLVRDALGLELQGIGGRRPGVGGRGGASRGAIEVDGGGRRRGAAESQDQARGGAGGRQAPVPQRHGPSLALRAPAGTQRK